MFPFYPEWTKDMGRCLSLEDILLVADGVDHRRCFLHRTMALGRPRVSEFQNVMDSL